jgi:hypothetical protein
LTARLPIQKRDVTGQYIHSTGLLCTGHTFPHDPQMREQQGRDSGAGVLVEQNPWSMRVATTFSIQARRRAHSRTPGSANKNVFTVSYVLCITHSRYGTIRRELPPAAPMFCFMLGPPPPLTRSTGSISPVSSMCLPVSHTQARKPDRSPPLIPAVDTDPPRRNKTTCRQHSQRGTPSPASPAGL